MNADRKCASVTELLHRHHHGDREAFNELVSLVYEHLRRIARAQLARGWPSNTLNTTALVHEAYMQLSHETRVEWRDRSHFFAISARAMRRILVDHARRHGARKRNPASSPELLHHSDPGAATPVELIVAVDEALDALQELDTRLVHVVECRYFAGMTEDETAEALGLSCRSVQRYWLRARAWLLKELGATTLSDRAT